MAKPETRIAADGVSIEKECKRCNQFKLLLDFRKQISSYMGVRNYCRECECKLSAEHRESNLEYYANYRKQNRAKITAQQVAHARKKKFGITPEQFEELAQGGCYNCGSFECLHVDHNHTSNEVRGILCLKCNTALGLLDENAEKILGLAEYLERTQSNAVGPGAIKIQKG